MPAPTRADRRRTIQTRVAALAGSQSADAVRAAADDTGEAATATTRGELWLYGVVGAYWWGFSSDSVAYALRQLGEVDEITVRLDSPGGDAYQGLSIANLLANHDAKVRVVVDGLAASAASQIALAGDEVVMSPGAQFMLHDAWMLTAGNAADLHSDGDFLDKQSQNYAETYAHRAGGTAEEWRAVMLADGGRGTWYTAQEAVSAGLADQVANVASTTTPPPVPVPDSGDDTAEARARFDVDVLLHESVRDQWKSRCALPTTPKPPSASAVGSHHTEGTESAVAFSDEQMKTMRAELGLAEDADEATIVAALSEALDERAETPTAPTPAASVPPGMTLIESDVLDSLRSGADDGRAARQEQRATARDNAIQAAIDAGKITPARREHWAAAWDADAEGAKAMLAALAPGLAVPVSEVGHADDPVDTESDRLYAEIFGTDEKKGA